MNYESIKSSKLLLVLLIIIAAAHVLGILTHWYWNLGWYDIPMHLAGGVWVGLLFFYIFNERYNIITPEWKERSPLPIFIMLLGFVALVGVLWEFYEYLTDVFLLKKYPFMGQQSGVFNTLKDLFNDLVGGLGAFLLAYFKD